MTKKKKIRKVAVAPVKVLSPTVLGQFRANYQRIEQSLAKKGTSTDDIKSRIVQRMTEDAEAQELTLEQFIGQLSSLKVRSSGEKVTQHKEQFRTDFDRLTNNLLASVNTSTDEQVTKALADLLDYDKRYQEITGIEQSSRNDFRGMIILSPHPKELDKLAIYRGGWSDGSSQERNQYSSGRRVPVAKTTGFALAQIIPKFVDTNEESKES